MARFGKHHILVLLVLLAAALLRAFAFSPFAVHHPDEAIQYIEQAHRLAFGTGLVPWEYREGMRSWLVPLLLAGPMRLGEALAPGSLAYVVLPRLTAALLAFAMVPAAYAIGRRISPQHGLAAMAVIALWYESVYFSVHVLTETLAVSAFFCAAALLKPDARPARLVGAGALLALAALVRFHYLPALAVFALVSLGMRWRDWGWLALGGTAAAIASGAIDAAMGQVPFLWIYRNFAQNILADKASEFGRYGIEAYGQMLWLAWSVALVPILWLAAKGARRFPALAAAALVNLAVHLLIGHKEYRFILLTTEIAILLAAIGSADLVAGRRHGDRLLAGLVAIWAVTSTTLALAEPSNPGWRRFEPGFRLAREARLHGACGLALADRSYWKSGGHTYRGSAPLYYVQGRDTADTLARLTAGSGAYDAIIAAPGHAPPAYRNIACRGDSDGRLCLAIRPGPCTRSAVSDPWRMQAAMEAGKR